MRHIFNDPHPSLSSTSCPASSAVVDLISPDISPVGASVKLPIHCLLPTAHTHSQSNLNNTSRLETQKPQEQTLLCSTHLSRY